MPSLNGINYFEEGKQQGYVDVTNVTPATNGTDLNFRATRNSQGRRNAIFDLWTLGAYRSMNSRSVPCVRVGTMRSLARVAAWPSTTFLRFSPRCCSSSRWRAEYRPALS